MREPGGELDMNSNEKRRAGCRGRDSGCLCSCPAANSQLLSYSLCKLSLGQAEDSRLLETSHLAAQMQEANLVRVQKGGQTYTHELACTFDLINISLDPDLLASCAVCLWTAF